MLSTKEKTPINIGTSNIRILGDRVLIETDEKTDNTTPGGIVLVNKKNTMFRQGKVVQVGTGRTDDNGVTHPIPVEIGDSVLFSYLSSTNIQQGDRVLTIVTTPNLFGVVED